MQLYAVIGTYAGELLSFKNESGNFTKKLEFMESLMFNK
jgi:hypothetical protein